MHQITMITKIQQILQQMELQMEEKTTLAPQVGKRRAVSKKSSKELIDKEGKISMKERTIFEYNRSFN